MATLFSVFKKIITEDKTKYDSFYSSSKAEIIINENDIDNVFKSIYTIVFKLIYSIIIENIQKSSGNSSGWIIDSVIHHTLSVSKYNPFAASRYIKIPKELHHPSEGLINIQNINDNECFKRCLVRYFPKRITTSDRDFARKLDVKDKTSGQN